MRRSLVRLAHEERGVALAFTIAVFLFLFVLCLSVYSVGETIRRKTELQDACDAAAYSAAVVQADALSRMAVVNRAMSWSYIQMTKAELDYYTYLWLERVRDRYASDSAKCLKVYKDYWPPFNQKCGWWHSKYSFLHPILSMVVLIDYYLNIYTFGLDCHEHVHDKPGDNKTYSKARWIGLGWDKPNRIRIGYSTGGELEWNGSDLCIPGSSQGLVEGLKQSFGEHGTELWKAIDSFQKDIISCNWLLDDICAKMKNSIPETVRRTLLENLPRTASGEVDETILDQYRYMCVGGISAPPPDYGDEGDLDSGDSAGNADVTRGSFFSGVRNVEEDELRFLNMADGLPKVRTGPNATVTLKDYFTDPDSALSAVREMAGGLDQWFIRCLPTETANSSRISLDRQPQYAIPGIVRCYKNANYDEGRSTGSILGGVAGRYNKDIHRGNHIFPEASVSLPNFASLFTSTGGNPSSGVPRGPGGHFGKHIRKIQKRYKKRVDSYWARIKNEVLKVVTAPIQGLLDVVNGTIKQLCSLDVDPSCKNELMAFADQCTNVGETTGLVAEYEWATAAWICGWCKKNGKVISCFHIPVPIGLAFGSQADSYETGLFKWLKPELKMFDERADGSGDKKKGFKRNEYHDTFIGLNTDTWQSCSHGMMNGRGANMILKGYARIYGDDMSQFNDCPKCQRPHSITDKIPARPWMLNEKFFAGAGTIIVAVAKEQRNVFDWIADAMTDDKGIHSAFSPKAKGEEEGKPVYYVAMAAGRAGPAPRRGNGRADGPDTDNEGVLVPHYKVAWDTVTDRTLGREGVRHPELAKGDGDLRASLERAFAKEGYSLKEIEEELRLGCACGEENTDRRLSRQWNLSQADWDGMLLPLRHAFSATASTNDTGLATSETPVWSWNESTSGGTGDPTGIELVYSTLRDIDWRRFDDDNKASETTKELVGGDAFNLPLLRRRRIL